MKTLPIFALFCALTSQSYAQSVPPDAPPPAPAEVVTLVGRLTEQGDPQCIQGQTTWINPRLEVGFSPISLADGVPAPAAELIGQAVVVRGVVAPSPRGAPITDDNSCPPMQMRSDWVVSKGGFRIQRSGSPASEHLQVTEVAAFTGLTLQVHKGNVLIALKNPLDVPLQDSLITVHYEGCYGKPGSLERTSPLGTLAPGKARSTHLPARVQDGDHTYVAHSVQLQATGARFDLDLPVPDGVACPQRHKTIKLPPRRQ